MAGSRRSRKGSRKGSRKQQRRRRTNKNAVESQSQNYGLPGDLNNSDPLAAYAAAFGNNIQQSIMNDASNYEANGGFSQNAGGNGSRQPVPFTADYNPATLNRDFTNVNNAILNGDKSFTGDFVTKSFDPTQPPVGAVITLYVTNTCGTCAYVKDSVLPLIVDKYTNAWKNALASGNSATYKPPLVSFLINMLPSSDPKYLPPGVNSVPALTLDYVNQNGTYNGNPRVLYEYNDWLNAATNNKRWARLGYANQFANEFFYTWFPTTWRTIDPDIWLINDDWFDTFFYYGI